MKVIDAHHHLWRYSPEAYDWIPSGSALAADHLAPEFEASLAAAGVDGTIAVQARQTLGENTFLLDLADRCEAIRGVVGWVPLIEPDVDAHLGPLAARDRFVGVRHVLQDEPDDYFLRDDFHRGLARLPAHELRYELLLFERQLPVAIRLVDRQPDLGIIVDHIAKPEVRPGRIESAWRSGMRELARRDHVLGVKFSGLVTEFPEGPIDPETIRAYFEETLGIFGVERVMFGTDWPVCLLRLDHYREWVDTVRDLVGTLSENEREAILGGNALRIYSLDPP